MYPAIYQGHHEHCIIPDRYGKFYEQSLTYDHRDKYLLGYWEYKTFKGYEGTNLKQGGGAYFLIKYLFLIESHHGLQRYPMVLAMDTLASGFFAASAGPVLHQKNSHLFTQCLYFIIQGSDP